MWKASSAWRTTRANRTDQWKLNENSVHVQVKKTSLKPENVQYNAGLKLLTMATCMESLSASLYTATERTPIFFAVRITRHAISPRLAISTFSILPTPGEELTTDMLRFFKWTLVIFLHSDKVVTSFATNVTLQLWMCRVVYLTLCYIKLFLTCFLL